MSCCCCKNFIYLIPILNYSIEAYLDRRQYRKLSEKMPESAANLCDEEEYNKSCKYNQARLKFNILGGIYRVLKECLFLFSMENLFSLYFQDKKSADSLFITLHLLFDSISNFPLNAYYDFVIEERFKFNKKTPGLFLKDFLLQNVILVTLSYLVSGGMFFIIRMWSNFYLFFWLFVSIISIVWTIISPIIILPLFNKFSDVENPSLVSKIEKMASKLNFPLKKISSMDGSKRSGHSNAFFTGFGKYKQIVLFDTLLNSLEEDEIIAVLCHELGHWYKSHVLCLMVIFILNLLGYSYVFNIFVNSSKSSALAVTIIWFSTIFSTMNMPTTLFLNMMTRKFERQADMFAIKHGYGEQLKSALIKLNKDNHGSPVVDRLYSAVNYSHPHVTERIELINRELKKNE